MYGSMGFRLLHTCHNINRTLHHFSKRFEEELVIVWEADALWFKSDTVLSMFFQVFLASESVEASEKTVVIKNNHVIDK